MSFAALAWASKQNVGRASDKLILLAYADRHNEETGSAYPSVAALCEFSCLDRKTVIASVGRLEALGLLTETGERAGNTKQIKVYRVNINTVPKAEQSQKRNSPVIPSEQSQKRDTEPVMEPISSEAKASSDKRASGKPDDFPMPEWADRQVWSDFLQNRKRKRLNNSPTAYRGFMQDIDRLSDADWPPGRLLEYAAAKGWGGIYDPRNQDARNGSGSRQVQSAAPDGRTMGRTEAAARAALKNLTGNGNTRVGGQTGPAIAGGNHGRVVALPDPDSPLRHVARR